MSMPSADEYREAIVYYRGLSLQGDPELAGGSLDMEPNSKFPVMRSGTYATVYMIGTESVRYGLRVFTREVVGVDERYKAIISFLKDHNLSFLFSPQFRPGTRGEGIFVAGHWYPYLKMPWIDGCALDEWVEERLKRRELQAVQHLAKEWVEVVLSLKESGAAHGDLQPGNILVDENEAIHLVDLDGMFVPGLEGKASVGVGWPSYQHPDRREDHFDAHLDDFSALVITVSLLALASDPSLRMRDLGEKDLVFTTKDLEEAEASDVFRRLLSNPDSEVRRLTLILKTACLAAYERTPCFAEIIDLIAAQEQAFSALKSACLTDDDEAIVRAWGDGSLLGSYSPAANPAIQARVFEAQQRLPHYFELLKAIDQNDDALVAAASDALELLGGYRNLTEPQHWRIGLARRRLQLLKQLRRAYRLGDDETARRWREDLRNCSQLTPRDRVRVSVALRAIRMEHDVKTAIRVGDRLALAIAYDQYLGSRRESFDEDEMDEMAVTLTEFASTRQTWSETLRGTANQP